MSTAPGGSPWNNYEICVRSDEKRYSKAVSRWKMQHQAGKLLPGERVAYCYQYKIPGRDGVKLTASPGKASFSGVMVCGSVWVCPVCASKISTRRREELREGIARSGLYPCMITLTIQHNRESDLKTLVKDLSAALRFAKSGRRWKKLCERWQLVGTVGSFEPTFSFANGHHPHNHNMILSSLGADEINTPEFRAELQEHFAQTYSAYLEKRGYLINDHTVDITTNKRDVEGYLTKWSLEFEVTSQTSKEGKAGHYSMFQLLHLITQGETQYIPAWLEYARVFKGRHQLHWSKGLRALLGLGDELTDAELAQEQEVDQDDSNKIEITFTDKEWRLISAKDREGFKGQLLEVARSADLVLIWSFLETNGIRRSRDALSAGDSQDALN